MRHRALLAAGASATLPSFVGASSTYAASGTTTVTVTPHASTATGHLLVATFFTRTHAGTVDTPSGWTAITHGSAGVPDCYVFHRTHSGAASYSFTRSVLTDTVVVVCSTFAHAALDREATNSNNYSSPPICPSVTPTATALLYVGWGVGANDGGTTPAGFTDVPDGGGGNMAVTHGYSPATYASGSPTGTITGGALSTYRSWRAITISIIGA